MCSSDLLNNSVSVDVFSSATKSKTKTGSLAGGSYHSNADGSSIDGITFPVKVSGIDLSKYKNVANEDSVIITVTKRGQTSTTTYTGKDALFENADYAYYVLSDAPSYYKEATVNADGSLSFGKTVGTATELSDVTPKFRTESRYGDYQLNLDGLENTIAVDQDQVYGVIVSTKEGNDYGMRQVDDAAGQDALFPGTALAAVEAAGDAAHGVQLLLKVHAQGEEVDTVTGTGRGSDAAQHAGIAVAHHDGGVGQLGQLAHLQREGTACQIHGVLVIVGELTLGDDR